MKVGDVIEVIDRRYGIRPIRGKVLEMRWDQTGSSGYRIAKIRVDSPALPPPEVWVNCRLVKVING